MKPATAALLVGLAALLPGVAFAETVRVPADYPTVAGGLAAATNGDTVLVACGVYQEHDLVMASGVTLRSETGDPSCVTVDAERRGRVVLCDDVEASTRIEGITLTGGRVSGESEGTWGGGILCINGAGPTITDCVLLRNEAILGYGAAIACVNSSPSVLRCVFRENLTTHEGGRFGQGGGMKAVGSAALVQECIFESNVAGNDGGGIRCDYSALTISGCRFMFNTSDRGGGGLSCFVSSPRVVGCTFTGNVSLKGGGISCIGSSPTITNTELTLNTAGGGGGIQCDDSSSPTITGCLISGNLASFGGGAELRYDSSPEFDGCVFARNRAVGDGGAIYSDHGSTIHVSGCTFAYNAAEGWGSAVATAELPFVFVRSLVAFNTGRTTVECGCYGSALCTVSCTDLFGNTGGDWVGCIGDQFGVNGNFSADPLFCDGEDGDYHLDCSSPCAPAQQPGCGLIGAWDVGCGPSATLPSTWGLVKHLFDMPRR